MPISQVTVTGTFQKSPGITSVGNLQWQLSADLFFGGQPVANRTPIPVTLVNGAFSVLLWANDDVGTSPSGTFWTLSGIVDGQGFSQNYVISRTMAPTVDLSQLTPASLSNPLFPVNATALQGVPVAVTAPTLNQALIWNGTSWTPSGAYVPMLAAVGPPTTGTWPANQSIVDANGAVWNTSAGGTPGAWFAAGSGVELAEAELSTSSANVTTALADVAGLSITFNAPARAFVLELYVPTVTMSASTTLCQFNITDSANTVITQANAQGGTAQGAAGNLFLRGRLPKVGGTAPYAITVGQSYTFKVRAVTNAGTANLIDGSDIERPILRAVTC